MTEPAGTATGTAKSAADRSWLTPELDAAINAYADRLVAAAPPFTALQQDALRSILAPAYERLIGQRAQAA